MQLQFLPSDILRDILSRLSLREVVKMSILSREWRQLGICHPDLVLTQDTFGRIVAINTDEEPVTSEFISKVDNLLHPLWATSTTTTTTLDKFVIKFLLGKKHKYNIDRWVNFSIASRAKHISLDFETGEHGFEDDKYVFPLCNLSGTNGSSVKYLDLGYVSLKLPPSFGGVMKLKTLALNRVSINPGDLRCLLLSCAFLESLRIEWCSWSSLCIRQELCRLQYLCVRHCELEMLELHVPNLTKFEFDEDLTQIMLSDCLKLSEVTFVSYMRTQEFHDYDFDDLTFTFIELATALPHGDKPFLLLNFDQMLRFSENQKSFINLRHLNVNPEIEFDVYDDSWVMGFINLLELAPLLEELELHVGRDRFCLPVVRMAAAAQGLCIITSRVSTCMDFVMYCV